MENKIDDNELLEIFILYEAGRGLEASKRYAKAKGIHVMSYARAMLTIAYDDFNGVETI